MAAASVTERSNVVDQSSAPDSVAKPDDAQTRDQKRRQSCCHIHIRTPVPDGRGTRLRRVGSRRWWRGEQLLRDLQRLILQPRDEAITASRDRRQEFGRVARIAE